MKTKQEIVEWLESMLPTDGDFLKQSASSYLPEIRELEALLRPFWGIASLLVSDDLSDKTEGYLLRLKEQLAAKSLPAVTTSNRQVVVEMAALAFSLGIGKQHFLSQFTEDETAYLYNWLYQINEVDLPKGNWLFFSILVNTVLKQQSAAYSELRLKEHQALIETFYLGDGWYSDGNNQQRDYYVAFAFHFYGLLYGMLTEDAYAQRYRQRAVLFSKEFIYWFDKAGRSIPFGRSLTYRFAHVAFWSMLIVSDAYQDTSFSLGQIKGLILRHFRWWQQQTITLPQENNLSIGYGYNNLLLSEDYNAPGSPMWGFKAFVILCLPQNHVFWHISEESLPVLKNDLQQVHSGCWLWGNEQAEHHVALSASQFSVNPHLLHNQEKYGKFAYSSYFGFNLSRDTVGIQQAAADSTLTISLAGTQQFRARQCIDNWWFEQDVLFSSWQAAGLAKVQTVLVPVDVNTHIRVHWIEAQQPLEAYEGGFPLFDWHSKYQTPLLTENQVQLTNSFGTSSIEQLLTNGQPVVVPQHPNTSIYHPEKNAVPAIQYHLPMGVTAISSVVYGSPDPENQRPAVTLTEKAAALHLTFLTKHLILNREDFENDHS